MGTKGETMEINFKVVFADGQLNQQQVEYFAAEGRYRLECMVDQSKFRNEYEVLSQVPVGGIRGNQDQSKS